MAEKIIAYLKQEADKEIARKAKDINYYFSKYRYRHNMNRRQNTYKWWFRKELKCGKIYWKRNRRIYKIETL